jgi:hypothetical protein
MGRPPRRLNTEDAHRRLKAAAECDRLDEYIELGATYHRQYRALLLFGDALCKEPNEDMATVLALASYGWMPPIPDGHLGYPNETIKRIANTQLPSSEPPTQKISSIVKDLRLLNNSIIGTSKFLHFLNPELFPIWDSAVAHWFGIKNANSTRLYLDYASFLHCTCENYSGLIDTIGEKFFELHKYRPSRIRCLELVLFGIAAERKTNRGRTGGKPRANAITLFS